MKKLSVKETKNILEAIINDAPLFIKDTGIKVKIDSFRADQSEYIKKMSRHNYCCHVDFIDKPSVKALNMCVDYSINRCDTTQVISFHAEVKMENLSTVPFETKGAKLLYGNRKTKIKHKN